jgi:hypothetical protein
MLWESFVAGMCGAIIVVILTEYRTRRRATLLGIYKSLGKFQKVTVASGDVLVLSYPHPMTDEMRDRVRAAMEQTFPGQRMLILSEGFRLSAKPPDCQKPLTPHPDKSSRPLDLRNLSEIPLSSVHPESEDLTK